MPYWKSTNKFFNMEQTNIKSLIATCHEKMIGDGYSESTIATHMSNLERGIFTYMSERGEEIYNPDIGDSFLESLTRNTQWEKHYRCIGMLNSVLRYGHIMVNRPPSQRHELPGEIGAVAKRLIELKRSERASPKTIEVYQRVISQFIAVVQIKGVKQVAEITESHIVNFISTSTNSRGQRLYVMKMFCKYLLTEGYVKYSLGALLDSVKTPQREKVPSVYNQDEIALIENSIDRSNFGGRRLYAMFLLASRLGLRVSDIIRLRFANLDWDKCTISIVQYKTKHEVVLPLLTDVGNAIMDYLQAERPSSDDEHVFISTRPPYKGVSRDTVWLGLQKAIQQSGVNIQHRRHGIHAFRHSLASQLLSKETPLPIISSTLGHMSTTTTSNYLRVDLAKLRSILLSPSLVPERFYTQKGGIFYE